MMTVKQVSLLTGVSVRTLQFYDEIGLFKPTAITAAGYRMYDETALEMLQQILFFKELDFTLKEIKAIMENPRFDKKTAFEKQRELMQIKRDRLDNLLTLLDKLIKGEKTMEFKDFDMNGYFRVLDEFKKTHTDEIVQRLGSMEAFDDMVSYLKSREDEIAEMAVRQFGSLEEYEDAAKKNFQKFLSDGGAAAPSEVSGLIEKSDALTKKLTEDLSKDAASPEILEITGALISYLDQTNSSTEMGENYWTFMAETYMSNPVFIEATDKKYGDGASKFIGRAILAYLDKQS